MSPIKDLELFYSDPNRDGTFSEGDAVEGTVSFTLTRDAKVKNIQVKLKGEARVKFEVGLGDNGTTRTDHKTYFKIKTFLLEQSNEGSVLPRGIHSFGFKIVIPQGDLPSSFSGSHGKIIYMLETKISRCWRLPSKVRRELSFISESHQGKMLSPHIGSVSQQVGALPKGMVQLFVTADKNVYSAGQTISVGTEVTIFSSEEMTLKFSLQQYVEYRAGYSVHVRDHDLCRVTEDTFKGNCAKTVICQMKIPDNVVPTIRNCEIISVEYYLKVYLSISFAHDPEVRLPLIIIPSRFINLYSAAAIGPPTCSDFPPPAAPHLCQGEMAASNPTNEETDTH